MNLFAFETIGHCGWFDFWILSVLDREFYFNDIWSLGIWFILWILILVGCSDVKVAGKLLMVLDSIELNLLIESDDFNMLI